MKHKCKQFYMVLTPDDRGTTFSGVQMFKTEDDAIEFAEALSKEHPTITFYIVESQAQVVGEKCEWHGGLQLGKDFIYANGPNLDALRKKNK